MTKKHKRVIHCPDCNAVITTQTAFSRWLSENARLDSIRHGFTTTDIDYLWHCYKHNGNRKVKYLMVIEEKSHQAAPSTLDYSQGISVGYMDQLFRNEKRTPTKTLSTRANETLKAITKLHNRRTNELEYVRMMGAHVLAFSGNGPEDSDHIWWDRKEITIEQLNQLLEFNLHPDPCPKHHKNTGSWFRPISNNGKTHHRRHDTQHHGDLFACLSMD